MTDTDPAIEIRLGRSFADQWQIPDLRGLPCWHGEFGNSGPDWEVYLSADDEDGVTYPDGLRVETVVNRSALSTESAEALALVLTTAVIRAREAGRG
ncbi:hypothetical protein [Nocardia salmonicida]|uniref:hypothetical protein n=1 Tax=Nocardia salmonicida TaxID=53431 RepID=UPI0007A5386A|nr:hypothetical protein [Nocardia salmonicida]